MQGYEGGSDHAADDATKARPSEEGARRSERFARSVQDGLSAHVAVLDSSGTIVATKPSVEGVRSSQRDRPANGLGGCQLPWWIWIFTTMIGGRVPPHVPAAGNRLELLI